MTQKKSCGAIVFKRNIEVKYLLLHYEAGHWDYVKGEVERGESEKDTALRELEEETGITDGRFIGDFREEISYFYKMRGQTIHKVVVFLLIETQTSEISLSFEHIGYEWLDYQKAMERLTYKNAKDVLEKAHNYLKNQRIVDLMDTEKVKQIIDFTNAERRLISSFDIPTDAFTPLLLSLRDGGDWSYSSEGIKTVAVMDKTTVYDDEKRLGYSLEEIYLFVNPVLKDEEGTVHRLEKCGEEEMRLLVRRPYKVRVVSDRIIKARSEER